MELLSRNIPLYLYIPHCSPTTSWQHAAKIWAISRSLATTWEITELFSSPPGT